MLRDAEAHGFLLTDGMGMGKTYQAIATAVLLLCGTFPDAPKHTQHGRVLVVLNSALIATWCEQIARHWKSVDMARDTFVYAGRDRLAKLTGAARHARFVFTTYETLRADANNSDALDGPTIFADVPFQLIILDEVHKARNGRRSASGSAGSALWRTLRRFPHDTPKLGLTGTPVCNHMMELCSIAQIVFKEHPLLASEDFWSGFDLHFSAAVVHVLRSSMLLRRTLLSEGIQLPTRHDIDIPITLNLEEKEQYRSCHERMEMALSALIDASERHAPPFVMKQARDRYASAVNALGLVTCGASKRQEVLRICREVQDRVVIVSRFVSVLESIRSELQNEMPDVRVAMFTGALDWKARGAVVDAFRARDVDVVLLSTMAGNEGVDFSCCQHLVLVDSASASNPMTHEDQVVARIYRIGQTKESHIHRLIAVSTIDDAFAFVLHAEKRANAQALLDMQLAPDDDEPEEQQRQHQSVFRQVSSTAALLRTALQNLTTP